MTPYARPPRRHRWDPRRPLSKDPSPPAPATVIVVVSQSGDGRFVWAFSQPFDDSHAGDWTAADFADLTVDGTVPGVIDEVIGADGTLTLIYPFRDAPTYHVVGTPAVLRFANGATAIVPESGPVLP
jgi:hypothetical protein